MSYPGMAAAVTHSDLPVLYNIRLFSFKYQDEEICLYESITLSVFKVTDAI